MKHINSILTQYVGRRDEALADLQVYIENPVGIGEHGDIGDIIRSKLEDVDRYDSMIDTMKRYFSPPEQQPEADTSD
tara:strand:+ start:286 stop:516 length:231 start_codon:yes stop_codon:yes gene_type:complete